MVDIHAHILPAVDDGSESLAQSIQMLEECLKNGVTDVVLTPHFRKRYAYECSKILQAFEDFKNIVAKQGVAINLYIGQEIYVGKEYKKLFKSKKILTLNQTNYVLLEFDYVRPQEIAEAVYELKRSGYIPIIAHVERYVYVDVETVVDIKNSGGLIQVNAGAIAGRCPGRQKRFVKRLFKRDLVDFVASDYHYDRKNCMKKAYCKIKRKYGKSVAEKTFTQNAKQIIEG